MSDKESKNFDCQVGKIVGAHGVRGHIKIRPSSNNPRLFLSLRSVLLQKQKSDDKKKMDIQNIDFERKMFFVKLKECDTRNDAEALVGLDVYTQKIQLQKLNHDEWWISDLIGLSVYSKTGEKLGLVSNVFGDQGEWLEISLDNKEGKTALIPFVKEIVPVVDTAQGRVEINTEIQGLLD